MMKGKNITEGQAIMTEQDEKNRPRKVLVTCQDIAEKNALQTEVIRTAHLASLGELAAGVAHEIINPINGIINYAQMMIDQGNEKAEEADLPKRIIKEGDRISKIVRNLLSFARDRNWEREPVNIKTILSDSLNLTMGLLRKDTIHVKLDIPEDLPLIYVDVQQIQQVFLNLISNARYALNQKFSGYCEDKILEIKGEVVEREGVSLVRTIFYDSGVGIPSDIIKRICDPFFSTKPTNEGTGLGLSISHGIVKEHGGRLYFQSSEGEYTKVIIELTTGGESRKRWRDET